MSDLLGRGADLSRCGAGAIAWPVHELLLLRWAVRTADIRAGLSRGDTRRYGHPQSHAGNARDAASLEVEQKLPRCRGLGGHHLQERRRPGGPVETASRRGARRRRAGRACGAVYALRVPMAAMAG